MHIPARDNPYAICTSKVGRRNRAKYERCVRHLKKKFAKKRQLQQGVTEYLAQLLRGTKPGAQKLQFPYEIPPIEIEFTKEAKQTLFTAIGILATGITLNGVMNYLARTQ